MNPLKKGPEIKMSDIKVPDFLLDLYYELQERHLLPLVGVLAVAIVAVPIVLSEKAEPSPGPVALAPSATQTKLSDIVAQSTPGLRDYKRRLEGLKARNPFKQQLAAAEEAGASAGVSPASTGGGGGGESTPAPSEPISPSPAPSSEPQGGGGGGGSESGKLKYYTWVIDVRVAPISTNGKKSHAKPYVLHEAPPLTMLPGRETPALVYIGPTKDGKKALMLVSSNVQSSFGDNTCVTGGETCQMLALEANTPETIVYGGNEREFRIELLKIKLVVTDEVNEASLGEPNAGKGSSKATGSLAPGFAAQPK
ncbi:MAG TPA: hypothetical protein VG518_10355 [Solirubrobacterales bacterium]|nr:hypothetical protein [Solirubrobacterales bacterium]